MDILCVDKTGTLTGDQYFSGILYGYFGERKSAYPGSCLLEQSVSYRGSNHLDEAILKYQEMPGQPDHFQELEKMHPKLDELPFNHERKFASVLVKGKEKNLLIIKGSVDDVCRRCGYVEYRGPQCYGRGGPPAFMRWWMI